MPNQMLQGGSRAGRLTPVLLGAVAGPALQLQQPALWPLAVYGLLAGAGLLLALGAWRLRRGLLLGVAVALLAGAVCGLRAHAWLAQGLDRALEGRDLVLTGRVAAMPQPQDTGLRFRFAVESATLDGQPVAVPPKVQLTWYGGVWPGASPTLQRVAPDLRAGDRWRLQVRLRAPSGHLNPHGFDHELWLWVQGLQAVGYVRAGPADAPPQRLGPTLWHPVEQARQSVRDAVYARLGPQPAAGVVAALVTGDQSAIERSDWDLFRATGVAHLMSISGLHVTLFAWVAVALIGTAWRRSTRLCLAWPAPHAALLGGLLCATAYAVFSGFGVPAQRTVWMLATVVVLRLSGRQWPWPQVWLAACAVVVGIDPWALMQPGFWLSFVAVGVLFATAASPPDGAPGAADTDGAAPRAWRRVGRAAHALLREQWVVTLALTPLVLLLFGQVSLVGLLANLVAIPWVTLLVTPLALLGVLVPALWSAAALAVQALSWGLQLLASWPWATVSLPAAPLWAGVAGVAGGVLLAWRGPLTWRLLGVPLLLPVLLWQAPRPPQGQFELLAADIGQGNAVIVRTARHTLVYDTGPRYGTDSDAGQRVLVPLLRALGDRVDRLVLSHRDSDHTGGAPAVLAQHPEAALLASLEPGHALLALRPATLCAAGQQWQWDGVRFTVLHPQPGAAVQMGRPNTHSCVLRVDNGARAALLTGDIEAAQEQALLSDAAALRADWLLVPHHGSKTSSSTAFLQAVQPAVAVVQAGYRNRFGHPAPEVMARYAAQGVAVSRSADCGAARWQSQRPDALLCERAVAPRYWHRRPG